MGFRQIYIEETAELSLHNDNIKIEKNDKSFLLPISDIDLIFVENPRVVFTARLVTQLSKNNVTLVLCDEKYIPTSISLPLNGSNNQIEIFNLQIEQLPSKKDKLWEYIIRQKIINHSSTIKLIFNDLRYLEFLEYSKNIKSGDKTFIEGAEARLYFRNLFGDNFIRHQDDEINLALNYGYSIINSAIIRMLVAAGIDPKIGVHHDNKKNFYNLASDLLEPYRAFVDYYVYKNKEFIGEPLSRHIRLGLVDLLNSEVQINNIKTTLSNSIKIMIYSFIDYLKSGDIKDIKLVSFYE